MSKLFLILPIVLIFSSNGYSQLDFNDFLKTLNGSSTGISSNFAEKRTVVVKGDPYLSKEWNLGYLYAAGKKTKALPLRFNLAENAFEVQTENDIIIIDSYRIEGVDFLSPQKAVFKNGFTSNEKENIDKDTMFEIIYDGDFKLLKKNYVSLTKAVATYGTANQEDVYKNYSKFYFYTANNEYVETKLKRKDILSFFEKKDQKKVEKYAKENNLSFKDTNEVAVILKYAEAQ